MTPRTRRIAALLIGIALLAVLLLSISLTGLELRAGGAFPGASGDGAAPHATAVPSGSSPSGALPAVEAILGALVLVLLVYFPSRLAGLLSIRNIIRLMLGVFVLVLLLGLLPRVIPGLPVLPPEEISSAATQPGFDHPVAPLGRPPAEFRWLTAAVLALGSGLALFLLFRRAARPDAAAAALRSEAEKALEDLRSGKDFQDVIMRCYTQMTEVLRLERNIERRESMTAREFEDWLEAKGIPASPIQRLTTLFETVRYGNERPSQQDEQAGLDCLVEITRHVGTGGEA